MISTKHNKNLAANFHKDTGILEITHTGADPVSKEDWELALSYPSYRLFIRVLKCNIILIFTLYYDERLRMIYIFSLLTEKTTKFMRIVYSWEI